MIAFPGIIKADSALTDPALIAYYDFREGGGTVLRNRAETGTQLDGVIHHGEWTQGRHPGKSALRFDGKTSYVEIPHSKLLFPFGDADEVRGELTLEVWIKPETIKSAGIVDRRSEGFGRNTPYGILMTAQGAMQGTFGGGRGEGTRSHRSFTRGTGLREDGWLYLVLTITTERITGYVNGIPAAGMPREHEPVDNGNPLILGAMLDARGRHAFHGLMDEFAVYGRALSWPEIQERYRMKTGQAPAHEAIAIDSPAGGEEWSAGSVHRIVWQTFDIDGVSQDMRVEYSTDGGRNWQVVAERTENARVQGLSMLAPRPNVGQFLWTVPDEVSGRCRVRVAFADAPQINAESETDFAVVPRPDTPRYRWTQVTEDAGWPARDGAGALVYEDKMWLIGGWNPRAHIFPRRCNNDVWSSADGAHWEEVKPGTFGTDDFDPESEWEGRHCAGYVVFKDKMWIVGGDANQGHYQPDVWTSTDGANWTRVADDVPWGQRMMHYTVVFRDKIWVLGGQTSRNAPVDKPAIYNDVWNSPDGINWTRVLEEAPWEPRGVICGHAVFNNRIWLLGGGSCAARPLPRLYHTDIWSSADGENWERHVEFAPWFPRIWHKVAVFDGKLWVLAGSHGGFGRDRNDVWYSSDGVNWYELPDTPWIPRHAGSVYVYQDALWIMGGRTGEIPEVWKLNKED